VGSGKVKGGAKGRSKRAEKVRKREKTGSRQAAEKKEEKRRQRAERREEKRVMRRHKVSYRFLEAWGRKKERGREERGQTNIRRAGSREETERRRAAVCMCRPPWKSRVVKLRTRWLYSFLKALSDLNCWFTVFLEYSYHFHHLVPHTNPRKTKYQCECTHFSSELGLPKKLILPSMVA
jgi:hypothetical protein